MGSFNTQCDTNFNWQFSKREFQDHRSSLITDKCPHFKPLVWRTMEMTYQLFVREQFCVLNSTDNVRSTSPLADKHTKSLKAAIAVPCRPTNRAVPHSIYTVPNVRYIQWKVKSSPRMHTAGVEVELHSFLNLVLGRWVVNFTPRPLCPQEKNSGSPCIRHNEKRTVLFWVITQWVVVISYRRFGTTCRSHLQRSRIFINYLYIRRVLRQSGSLRSE